MKQRAPFYELQYPTQQQAPVRTTLSRLCTIGLDDASFAPCVPHMHGSLIHCYMTRRQAMLSVSFPSSISHRQVIDDIPLRPGDNADRPASPDFPPSTKYINLPHQLSQAFLSVFQTHTAHHAFCCSRCWLSTSPRLRRFCPMSSSARLWCA